MFHDFYPQSEESLPQTLDGYFQDAFDTVKAWQDSDRFVSFCANRNIPLDETRSSNPSYWEAFADFAYVVNTEAYQAGVDTRILVMHEVAAATPDYVLQQARIDNPHREFIPNDEFENIKYRISHFNGLVRYAAEQFHAATVNEQFPELTADSMTDQLVRVARANLGLQPNDLRDIRQVIRGVQHELTFTQLLGKLGRDYRRSSMEEDLRSIDYVIADPDVHEMAVDVKAAMFRVGYRKPGEVFGVAPDGVVGIPSPFSVEDLHGRFYVDDWEAADRAKELAPILKLASTRVKEMFPDTSPPQGS